MTLILIAAMAKNRTIGNSNQIPWKIKGEQKLFKQHTIGHTVIMGRKTYESIGNPLPNRKNIVITRQEDYPIPEEMKASSIEEALTKSQISDKVFIIGGANIYQQCLHIADYIYLTIIDRDISGDALFPEIPKEFTLMSSKTIELSEPVTFNIYKRSIPNLGIN